MGNRRFAQVAISDDEDDVSVGHPETRSSSRTAGNARVRKKIRLECHEEEEEQARGNKNGRQEPGEEAEEEAPLEDAKPIGDPVRFSGKGRGRRRYYNAFEFDGNRYELEDPVLLVPEDKDQKPYVAIIKDITQTRDDSVMVLGQWFYRPEEAARKGGGSWQSQDTRELFYSFHRDEVPAESVMHKCVVHFVPLHKQIPNRKLNPGFIVQKVYDTVEKKLWKLTDKDYEDNKQHEIDLLVQKTLSRVGDLPYIENEETIMTAADQEDKLKVKKTLRKKNISSVDVSRDDEVLPDALKPETPRSCANNMPESASILVKFNVLTGDSHRDKWLERLLQCLKYMCNSPDGVSDGAIEGKECKSEIITANRSEESRLEDGKSFLWPDAAVRAASALEKASHDALSADLLKYNQKLRQLVFNLKNSEILARRLLNGELEPSKILNMSPNELKEGLTAEETEKMEPDESERMQMTDARCSRCNEFKVGVRDIIQAGHGARYQLECIACGNSWYASRDEVTMLTIDGPSSARNVGTAPLATTKFVAIEKNLTSPRGPQKAAEVFKKTTEPYMPVLESHKSFSKPKNEENPQPGKNSE